TSRRCQPTPAGLRLSCPAAATADSSSSPLATPVTSPAASAQSRSLAKNILQPLTPDCGRRTPNCFALETCNLELATVGALPALPPNAAPPHKPARRFCPSPSVPRRGRPARPRPAPLSHRPRPAGQDNMTEKNLPLWLGRWPGLGGSG